MARILVVEDDDDLREAYTTCLTHDGHAISAVATGEEALDVLSRQDCDLLIVDLYLPGMDGAELCRAIRGREKTRDCDPLPILMVTNMSERMGITVKRADLHWAPVDRFVDKATAVGELTAIAAELLAHHSGKDADARA